MAQHNDLGKSGEEIAAAFLLKKGHAILARNYRFQKAEIDIVSKVNNLIVFTEVKTRSSKKFGEPEEAINHKKQQLLCNAASNYMDENNLKGEVRFDIISIIQSKHQQEIYHIEDAFFPVK